METKEGLEPAPKGWARAPATGRNQIGRFEIGSKEFQIKSDFDSPLQYSVVCHPETPSSSLRLFDSSTF